MTITKLPIWLYVARKFSEKNNKVKCRRWALIVAVQSSGDSRFLPDWARIFFICDSFLPFSFDHSLSLLPHFLFPSFFLYFLSILVRVRSEADNTMALEAKQTSCNLVALLSCPHESSDAISLSAIFSVRISLKLRTN